MGAELLFASVPSIKKKFGKRRKPSAADIEAQRSKGLNLLSEEVNKPLEGSMLDDPKYLLDNQTRGEINDFIKQRRLNEAATLWKAASIGTDAKFKARVATQAQYETFLDKPGASQTRVASLLDAYKGQR